MVADVTHHIIGVDFLSHFGLLVDCRKNRLLDGVTLFSAPATASSALIPIVKTISDATPFDSLLAEFPHLTRPVGVQREVENNTAHHIRNVTGPPVTFIQGHVGQCINMSSHEIGCCELPSGFLVPFTHRSESADTC
jgi:hypothetical protein